MADEPITNPSPETQPESRAQERITQLSEKVKQEAEARTKAEAAAAEATRERDFYAKFSDLVASNPAAKDHKDDILSKVKSGYEVEDATFAVLGKAGKLGTQARPEPENPAGGSAVTQTAQPSEKKVSEMTQDERRKALEDAIVWQ